MQDALAMYYLTNGGEIRANTIFYKGRLADSIGLELGDELEQLELKFIGETSIQDIYIAQYEYIEPQTATPRGDSSGVSGQRIYAVGKQTIRPGKLYESWSSAEIEALKELSRVKEAKLRSILKEDGKGLQVLIQLQSHTRLNNARIERRWIAGNVLHVEASDTFGE